MQIKKIVSYSFYRIARCAPASNLRIFALKKVSYVRIGDGCYIGPNLTITPFGGEANLKKHRNSLLVIGNRVTISPNVSFLCSMHPEKSKLSRMYGKTEPIVVEDDAWIGAGAIIMGGIKIHKCSIVGAGAVVTKNVLKNSVVAGVPAKVIKNLPALEE